MGFWDKHKSLLVKYRGAAMENHISSQDIKTALKEAVSSIERFHTVMIEDLKDDNLRLLKPIPVFIEYDRETVIANYYDTESFGYGDSEYEALNDLCRELVQTYNDLEEDKDNLGILPSKWRRHLQTVIGQREDVLSVN